MTLWDYFVGFEREPEGLEAFLYRQGYDQMSTDDGGETYFYYQPRKGRLVNIFCFSKSLPGIKDLEVPDWKGKGYEIVSEIMISTEDPCAIQKAENMAKRTVKKYDAILYVPQFKEFLTRINLHTL